MAEFSWKITSLECTPDTKIVRVVYWELTATDSGQSVTIGSSQNIEQEGDIVPYENLTEADVIGWVQSLVDVTSLQASALSKIAKLAPETVTLPLPWEVV